MDITNKIVGTWNSRPNKLQVSWAFQNTLQSKDIKVLINLMEELFQLVAGLVPSCSPTTVPVGSMKVKTGVIQLSSRFPMNCQGSMKLPWILQQRLDAKQELARQGADPKPWVRETTEGKLVGGRLAQEGGSGLSYTGGRLCKTLWRALNSLGL